MQVRIFFSGLLSVMFAAAAVGQETMDMPRGTFVAVADSPMGPFKLLNPEAPVAPDKSMTLDGTLYVDPAGKPWMVYAHKWVQ